MNETLKGLVGALILLNCVAANAGYCDVFRNGMRRCYDKSELPLAQQKNYDTQDCVRIYDGQNIDGIEKCTPKPTPQQQAAQQAADQAARRVLPFTDPNKQFQVTCPTASVVVLNSVPGFTVYAGNTQADLYQVDQYGSALTCHYVLSNHSSGVLNQAFPLDSKLTYKAEGKQCGRSKDPCKDASCALVCYK